MAKVPELQGEEILHTGASEQQSYCAATTIAVNNISLKRSYFKLYSGMNFQIAVSLGNMYDMGVTSPSILATSTSDVKFLCTA